MTVLTWPHPRPGVDIQYAAVTLPPAPAGGGWWTARVVENGALVLLGSDAGGDFSAAVLTTPGGSWVVSPAVDTGADYFDHVVFGGGAYVASQRVGNTTRAYMRTTNPAVAWTKYNIAGVVGGASGIGFGNGFFVCAASNGNWSARSADALTWTTQTGLSSGLRYAPPVWDGAKYIQPTSGGVNTGAAFSTNGLDWTGTASAGFGTSREVSVLASGEILTIVGGPLNVYDNNLANPATFDSSSTIPVTDFVDLIAVFGPVFVKISFNRGVTKYDTAVTHLIAGSTPIVPYNSAPVGVWDGFPVIAFEHPTTFEVVPTTMDAVLIPLPPAEIIASGDTLVEIVGRKNYDFVIGVNVPDGTTGLLIEISFGATSPAGYADFYALPTSTFVYDTYLDWVDVVDRPTASFVMPVSGPGTVYLGIAPWTDGSLGQLEDMTITATPVVFWTDFVNAITTST